jgi:uncharacterized protein with von Willebrand factor type A (vWA) domain
VNPSRGTPVQRLLDFAGHLRRQGYRIGVGEMVDLVRVISADEFPDPGKARHGLRALCCRNSDEWRDFDRHFDQFWFPPEAEQIPLGASGRTEPPAGAQGLVGMSGASSRQPDSTHGQSDIEGSGAGRQRTLGKADFRFLRDRGAMREVEVLAERLGGGLRRRPGRRWVASPAIARLDIRRTLRRSLGTGGLPLKPGWARRKPAPLHLVILHDVSHSMTWNNPLLFRFVRGLLQRFHDSRAFAFHTHLFEVGQFFRESSLAKMQKRLDARENLWLGGTCIARSLAEFNSQHGRSVRSDSHVVIISDGFDTDDPEMLRSELDVLRGRCRQILWLNPMLGRKGVTLTSEQLARRLPMVDRFLPANSLDGLRAAIDALTRLTAPGN